MIDNTNTNLDAREIELVQQVVEIIKSASCSKSGFKLYLFGSRVGAESATQSDIDLALDAPDFDQTNIDDVLSRIDEIETLYSVDLHLVQQAEPSFITLISQNWQLLYSNNSAR